MKLLLLWCFPLVLWAHTGTNTSLLLAQKEQSFILSFLFDPLLFSDTLQSRGTNIQLSQSSLQSALPVVSLWLDEGLVLKLGEEECASQEHSISLQEGALIEVKVSYQCPQKGPFFLQSTLFLNRQDPHPIEASLSLSSGTTFFVFTQEQTTFRETSNPIKKTEQLSAQHPSYFLIGVWHSLTSPLHWLLLVSLLFISRARWVWIGMLMGSAMGGWLPFSIGWMAVVSLAMLGAIALFRKSVPAWALFFLGLFWGGAHAADLFCSFSFLSRSTFYWIVFSSLGLDGLLFGLGRSFLNPGLKPLLTRD